MEGDGMQGGIPRWIWETCLARRWTASVGWSASFILGVVTAREWGPALFLRCPSGPPAMNCQLGRVHSLLSLLALKVLSVNLTALGVSSSLPSPAVSSDRIFPGFPFFF
jgi:hypothetical protein